MNKNKDCFKYDLPGFKDECYLNNKIYRLWIRMIDRCYNPKTFNSRPLYKFCYICDRWTLFSNFVNDIKLLPNYKDWELSHLNKESRVWSIDKDILQPNIITKVYSPTTCTFLKVSDNSSECMFRNRLLGKCVSHDISKFKIPCIAIDSKDTSKFYYFESLNDMYTTLKISSRSSGKVFNGLREKANGYYVFKIQDGKILIPKYTPEYKRKVKVPRICIIAYHDTIPYPRYFISISQAAKELNLCHSSICRVLKGEYTHTHGWYFEKL